MFNPLVDSFENLTDTEVENKISELSRKYFLTHNPQLQTQIAVVLDMFKDEMRARQARAMQKMQENGDNDLDDLINIS